ncbi:MAG: hypothetical protein J5998_09575, partial [Clostridia bacterium]|nr:hypothetical protein [Clostridia bacterium]
YGANFPVLVGSMPMFFKKDDQRSDRFVGAAVEAKDGEIAVTYTDNHGWREPAFTVPFGAAKQ